MQRGFFTPASAEIAIPVMRAVVGRLPGQARVARPKRPPWPCAMGEGVLQLK